MTFARVKPSNWSVGEKLQSAQMNSLDIDHANAMDKVNGDTFAGGTITITVAPGFSSVAHGGIVSDAFGGVLGSASGGVIPTVAGGISDGGIPSGIEATIAGGITSTVVGGISSQVAHGITDGGTVAGISATIAGGITTTVARGIAPAIAHGISDGGISGGIAATIGGGISDGGIVAGISASVVGGIYNLRRTRILTTPGTYTMDVGAGAFDDVVYFGAGGSFTYNLVAGPQDGRNITLTDAAGIAGGGNVFTVNGNGATIANGAAAVSSLVMTAGLALRLQYAASIGIWLKV